MKKTIILIMLVLGAIAAGLVVERERAFAENLISMVPQSEMNKIAAVAPEQRLYIAAQQSVIMPPASDGASNPDAVLDNLALQTTGAVSDESSTE